MKVGFSFRVILVAFLAIAFAAGCGNQLNDPVTQEQDHSGLDNYGPRAGLRAALFHELAEGRSALRGDVVEEIAEAAEEDSGRISLLSLSANALTGGPYPNFRFLVEIDGITQASFSEAWLLEASVEVIEYRTGNDPNNVLKLPGRTTYGNLVLKWGITDNMELYNWFEDVTKGIIDRANLSVVLLDQGGEERARWNFSEAWPTKYDAPELAAMGNDIAIETLELAFEGMVRAH